MFVICCCCCCCCYLVQSTGTIVGSIGQTSDFERRAASRGQVDGDEDEISNDENLQNPGENGENQRAHDVANRSYEIIKK